MPKLESAPSFSPDGTKIVFETYRNGNYDIYVRSLRGGKPTHLTDEESEDRYPDWSPDGNSVVYSSNRDGIGFKLYLIGLDGGTPTQLTDSSQRADIYPAFSPDGTKIAFEGVTFPEKSKIYVLDTTDTGTVITLTSGGDNHTPNWSPDGRMIAYQRKGDIFLTMADGSKFPDGQKEISLTDTRNNYFPVFSPQVEKKTISGGTVIKNFYMAFSSYQWGRNEDILLLSMEERSDTANNWFIKSRVVSNLTESRDYESDPDWQ